MSSSTITKQDNKVAAQTPQHNEMEASEHSTKTSASAGLNLNLAGAVSGLFTSRSKKETAEDGSSVEHREDQAKVKGAGAGNMNANAKADAEEKGNEVRRIGSGQ